MKPFIAEKYLLGDPENVFTTNGIFIKPFVFGHVTSVFVVVIM